MISRFVDNVQKQHLFSSEKEVLLAVSGGIDSSTLVDLVSRGGFRFAIAHCNFHLRQGDSDRDEQFVRALAERYGVPCHVAQFDTVAYAKQEGLCIEDAARRLRYDFFDRLLLEYGYSAVATAHHRDDAAETFFINLLRGTGLAGLHGILPRNGHVVRPLLSFGRDEIERYAQANSLPHVEDATNASLIYRRNQVRHQLLPLLRQLQPSFDQTMQRTIAHLASAELLLNAFVSGVRAELVEPMPDGGLRVNMDKVAAYGPSAKQLLFELLRPYGFSETALGNIMDAEQPGKRFLSAEYTAILDRGFLVVYPTHELEEPEPTVTTELFEPSPSLLNDLRSLPSSVACFDADQVKMPLSLRHWRQGDRFQPYGMNRGSQPLSNYFIDHKIPLHRKSKIWLLCDSDDQILWVVGHRTDHRFRVTPETRNVLRVMVHVERGEALSDETVPRKC